MTQEDAHANADGPTNFGRYQLIERIARGGMAEVFKAKSHGVEGFEKIVVIKRILPQLSEHQAFIDMFLNEARLSVVLSHANIVQVFDLGRVDDTYFIAMEHVAGFDFGQAIRACRRAGQPLSIALCVYIGCEVSRALDYAHRRKDASGAPLGVVHRDVSPQNVLLSFEGEIKVTDFGIAKARSTVEAVGTVKGKHAYMSPEQAEGRYVDARADVYALGVTLYEALAGRNPFFATDPAEMRRKALAGEYKPLKDVRPDAPDSLVELIERAMARATEARVQTAARMYEELTAVLRGLGKRVGPRDVSEWLQSVRALRAAGDDLRGSIVPESGVSPEAPSLTPALEAHHEVRSATLMALVVNAEEEVARAVTEPLYVVAARHGATMIQRTSNTFTVAFGIEQPDGRDTFTATRLALRLQAAALRAALALEPIATVGAGVHPVELIVRGDGVPERTEELEEALELVEGIARAARNRVLASDPVASAGADHFECLSVAEGAVLVKGELPLGRRRVAGRRELFRAFGELLARAANDGARVVTLRGEAGVGKSRLLEEVVYRLRKMGHPVTWFSATCLPHERHVPLSALRSMLRAALSIDETDPESVARERATRLRDYRLSSDEMLAVGALLGAINVGGDSSAASTRALRTALQKFARGVTTTQVTVLAWDGAESMDDASRARIHDLVHDLAEVPVCVVVASRPGTSFPWEADPRHHQVELGPLDDEELRSLIALRLHNLTPPDDLVANLKQRCHSNPFCVEEYIKSFVQSGAVTVSDGALYFTPPEEAEVPRTVKGLAASSLTHLAQAERRLLQVASMCGAEFTHALLLQVSGLELPVFEAALRSLTAAGVVAPSRGGSSRFVNPVLRGVVADAIAPQARKALGAEVRAATQRRP